MSAIWMATTGAFNNMGMKKCTQQPIIAYDTTDACKSLEIM